MRVLVRDMDEELTKEAMIKIRKVDQKYSAFNKKVLTKAFKEIQDGTLNIKKFMLED